MPGIVYVLAGTLCLRWLQACLGSATSCLGAMGVGQFRLLVRSYMVLASTCVLQVRLAALQVDECSTLRTFALRAWEAFCLSWGVSRVASRVGCVGCVVCVRWFLNGAQSNQQFSNNPGYHSLSSPWIPQETHVKALALEWLQPSFLPQICKFHSCIELSHSTFHGSESDQLVQFRKDFLQLLLFDLNVCSTSKRGGRLGFQYHSGGLRARSLCSRHSFVKV
mmetsp:Transcript_81601/g.129096  ORF Transcript_81601/g.129096 Transcript_81601/m.129096 type:complete len:222 (+) Transcript_81601:477-1142(+)